MSEENKQRPQQPPAPRICERTAATYAALKAEPGQEKYGAFMSALEQDVLEGRVGFLPIAKDDVEKLQKTGEIKWTALKTPNGPALAAFTSPRFLWASSCRRFCRARTSRVSPSTRSTTAA